MTDSHLSAFSGEFHRKHADLLCESYERLTGKRLPGLAADPTALVLFDAPFALVSHGTEDDPVFNFANRTALDLFEMSWDEFTALPSRKSAEPVNREERARLLARVTRDGYIDDYSGVRISSSGRRFLIENAVVWNLIDGRGVYHGQAAVFDRWSYL
ncbi:MEKHLA domain-containing protein [Accumulibacter sp.]|uniref:MEKHLA domain-containing protein n=1 Tax=Accumulibacter sp. TaxID=2053492 RepID=UPI0025E38CED|nr:MEKHLA domain-containing protein [Accumulibacter sp.]MCP5228876.1 MEKHLA domain-containing protein [Accumulibacter sp.]